MRDKIKNIIKEKLKQIKETSATGVGGATMTPGSGAQYATKYSFKKGTNEKGVKNPYYYKLGWKPVPDKIKGSGLEVKKLFEEDNKYNDFQQKEIDNLDQIEKLIQTQLSPALDNAKDTIIDAYNGDPSSYQVVRGTGLALKFLQDTIDLLNGKKNENP